MPQLENAANLRRRYADIDLVISCGDMPAAYLDFIVTIMAKPLMFVRGNHDEMYEQTPPGGINLHESIVNYGGLTFAGLEGSLKYSRGKIQYTQFEMHQMVLKMAPAIKWHEFRTKQRIDVFVAHSPPRGIHDIEDDLPHRGFDAFVNLLHWYRPRYFLHGHVHTWDRRRPTETVFEDTTIMNINPYTIIDVEAVPAKVNEEGAR